MTDPIADMLTRIRNAYMNNQKEVVMPYSNLKAAIAAILKTDGYLDAVKESSIDNHKNLKLNLKYISRRPVINHLERVSKPGRRIYVKANNLPRPLSGYGTAIISTSQGVMTSKEARQKKLGGEFICRVW